MKLAVFLMAILSFAPSAWSECKSQMNFGAEFRSQVQSLEDEVSAHKSKVEVTEAEIQKLKITMSQLRDTMNFREKNLFSWLAKALGGNSEKINAEKNHSLRLQTIEDDLDRKEHALDKANGKVVALLREWFIANDQSYRELEAEQKKLYEIVCAGKKCLQLVSKAMDLVDSAQSDDLLATALDSTSMDLVAASDTAEASRAIRRAKTSLKSYRSQVESFKKDLQTHRLDSANSIEGVDPTLQLVIDIVFDSHFMDMMSYFALSEAESQLATAKSKITGIHHQLLLAHNNLRDQLKSLVCAGRAKCRLTLP